MIKKIIGTNAWKNSTGLVVNEIIYDTPEIGEKIVSIALTNRGWGSNLKISMLEGFHNVALGGKVYS